MQLSAVSMRLGRKLWNYKEAATIFLAGGTTIAVMVALGPVARSALAPPGFSIIPPGASSTSTSTSTSTTATTLPGVPPTTTAPAVPGTSPAGDAGAGPGAPTTPIVGTLAPSQTSVTIPPTIPTITFPPTTTTIPPTTTTRPPILHKCKSHNPNNHCKAPLNPPPSFPPGKPTTTT